LDVEGEATVLNGVNVGWAVVRLVNKNGVASNLSGNATSVNIDVASQNTADEQFYKALGNAIRSLKWQAAADQITLKGD
jgi:hypothetical protein